jgi:transcriptional regulator with XRE-family HTH domain
MFTPLQLRAARVLAGWSRADLAAASGTAPETIQGFEARGSDPKRSTMLAWRSALAKAGVEFTDETEEHGPGVRLRKRR